MTNKELSLKIFEQIYSKGNLDLIEETHDEHVRLRDPSQDTILEGPEAVRIYVTGLRTGFPDFRINVERQIAEKDLVASQVVCHGTHKGEFMNVPPTNREIETRCTVVQRFRNEMVVEAEVMWDVLGFLTRLGLKPAESIHDELAAAVKQQRAKARPVM